ncbi:MAG: MBL fold metallo-hydrolase [Nanoarchaeota archaeon]
MKIGHIELAFLGHSGFLITNERGERIAIDPYNLHEKIEKADYIFITHSHYDHCSIKDVVSISKKGTVIVIPADVQSKITKIEGVEMHVIEAGEEISFGEFKVEALPAYNINKIFHSKADGWIGYLIKFNNVIIYHAGDSDKIPEMEKLTGYGKHENDFIALLPVSGTYVMTAEEAAEAAVLIKPSVAIPMHYGAGVAGTREDAENFVKLCNAAGVHAEILEKI